MEPFSLIKFITGFNIFNGAKLGKLIFFLILVAFGIGVYHKLFVQRTIDKIQRTSIQHVEHLELTQDHDSRKEIFFGLRIRRFKLGVSYE